MGRLVMILTDGGSSSIMCQPLLPIIENHVDLLLVYARGSNLTGMQLMKVAILIQEFILLYGNEIFRNIKLLLR